MKISPPKDNIISSAIKRIQPYLHITPIIKSDILNNLLGHQIFFKAEVIQKTGAFKIRGVLNHLLELKEHGRLPTKIVGYSTGNHGIGLAYAAKILHLHSRIYLPSDTSAIKQQTARYYGAEVILTATRQEAEDRAHSDIAEGYYYLHPSDSDSTIAGAGTMCFEALQQLEHKPDAIFAACGGGGLLSGTYLAKEALSPSSLLIGTEPSNANDAYLSIKQGSIHRFTDSPNTIADGLRTLGVSQRAFNYLSKLDDFFLADEEAICYWTVWLAHLLKITCEPSCALNMVAVVEWLRKQSSPKTVLVLLSGGNIDPSIHQTLWKENHLAKLPDR